MLSSPLPLQGWCITLLIGAFFATAIGSADPWWRPKEWWVFCLGGLWLAVRTLVTGGSGGRKFLWPFALLLGWIVLQTSLLHILPIVQAKGKFLSIPWVWLTLIHIILITVWFQDLCGKFSEADFRPIWRATAVIGTVLSILMLLQSVGLDPVELALRRAHGDITWLTENHVIGLMGNPFQAGACLAIVFPVLVALGWWIPVILAGLVLLTTHSASSILAGGVGALVALWLSGRRLECWIAGGVGLLTLLKLPPDFLSLSGRAELWKQSIEVWKSKFFLMGGGLGTYKLLGIQATANPDTQVGNAVRWAHNEWIQVGCELGLIGLVLLISALTFIILTAWRQRALRAEASGILATGAILSVASIPFHMAPTAVLILMALACTISAIKEA